MNIPARTLLFVLTAGCAILLCGSLAAQDKKNPAAFTVVLDPGHGGRDPGATYSGVKEKDVNLAVALKLGKLIADNCPDVNVVYTRKTDVFIELDERGKIANRAGANLFISLHADAIDGKPSVNGSSTYIMGVSKTEESMRSAMRENSVIKYEEDYSEKYEGFDPENPESYIIFSLMQYGYFDRSLMLANAIQKLYAKNTPYTDRGAKQAGYLVLYRPAMPSVLTEMGFVSNESDRKYMTSEKGQNAIAKSLFEAFVEYRGTTDKRGGETTVAVDVPAVKPETKPEKNTTAATVSSDGAGYCVQLCASRSRISLKDSRFKNLPAPVVEKQVDGWYKYVLGGYSDLGQAQNVQTEVRKGTFKDAFVTAFDGNEQIGMNEAKKRIAAQNKK